MSEQKHRQSSDHMQNGGGLQPGQNFSDLVTTKPDAQQDAGGHSLHSHDRGREHTRGKG